MGAAESTPDDPSTDPTSSSPTPGPDLDSIDVSGWLILHVQPNSPCDNLSIVPYLDLLTHVNSSPLTSHEASLLRHIRPNVPITVTLFSLSLLTSRTLTITPRPHSGDGLLGLLIRHDSPSSSTPIECLHVLRVHAGSPAAEAGLCEGNDWLLGSGRVAFKGWQQFDGWLEREEGREVSVWAFNRTTWRVREVPIRLRKGWGGEGSLGADLAHGWKHRMPLWEEGQRRPVRLQKKSGLRMGKRGERGLGMEEEQLFIHIPLMEGGEGNEEAVPLLSIRVREPWEDSSSLTPLTAPERVLGTTKDLIDNHHPLVQPGHSHSQHGDHGHSQGGHNHGHGEHGHSHGQPAAISHPTGSTAAASIPPPPARAPVVSSNAAAASGAGKKALTAHLPRSRESSPKIQPTSSSAASTSLSASSLSPLPQPTLSLVNAGGGGGGGASPMGLPFPSLAPNTAAFNPAGRNGQSIQDFT